MLSPLAARLATARRQKSKATTVPLAMKNGTAASARCGADRIAVRKLRAIFRGPLSATILSRKNEVAPATTRCRGRSIYVALSRLLARSTTLALSACLACPVDNMLDNPIKRLLALRVRDAEKRL